VIEPCRLKLSSVRGRLSRGVVGEQRVSVFCGIGAFLGDRALQRRSLRGGGCLPG
jgi:hypothetical protein